MSVPDDYRLSRLILSRVVEGGQLTGGGEARARLLERAADRGVFPPVYRALVERGEPLPSGAQRLWVDHVARLSLVRRELARAAEALEPAGPVVVLKGQPLAELLYGDGRLRNTTDIDLLVDPARLDGAIARLADLGYRPMHGGSPRSWAYNQLALVHPSYATIVELHWRLAFPHLPSPAIAELLADTTPVHIDGRPYQTLHPELLFLHLCYHFHQHVGFLKGLLDVAGWLDRFATSVDLGACLALADDLGVSGLVQWPLHAIRLFTGCRPPMYQPRPTIFARLWAVGTAVRLERDFVELAGPTRAEAPPTPSSTADTAIGVLEQAASMAVVDGAGRRTKAVLGPVFLGPHRVGRGVFAGLERLGLADREALLEARIMQ